MAMWHDSDKVPCDEGIQARPHGSRGDELSRFAPAGLLVEHDESRVMIDEGSGADSRGRLDAWLVNDERAELIREIRDLARDKGLEPGVGSFSCRELDIRPRPSGPHITRGLRLSHPLRRQKDRLGPQIPHLSAVGAGGRSMFADAAGWKHPIRFVGGVGGHAATLDVAREAKGAGVERLVFAHIGRPAIRAMDAGERPWFGVSGVKERPSTRPLAQALSHGLKFCPSDRALAEHPN